MYRLLSPRKLAPPSAAWHRSRAWHTMRGSHLSTHPTCAACGSRTRLQVHHVVPVSVDPSRMLDPSNLITLCNSFSAGVNCHLFFGHVGNWTCWNPDVRIAAAALLSTRHMRLA